MDGPEYMSETENITLCPDIEKPNRHNLPDAAHADICLPREVTILAPGRNGRFFWQQARGCVIAVNRAIQIPLSPPLQKDIWIVADHLALRTGWMNAGLNNYYGCKIFSEDINNQLAYPGNYTFWMHPNKEDQVLDFFHLPYRIDCDFFRSTESVTGIAIDFAIRYGALEVNLLGADGGGPYYDDPLTATHNVVNDYVFHSLQKEIDYFTERGIKFNAISPTRLVI